MKSFLVLLALATTTQAANMNGEYVTASGGKFDVPFNSDYASKGHEYFDVWAPEIATHYGEVFWTDQGNQPLPPQIVKRFAGKVIALTGYEQDQVMVTPTGQPGVNPDKDVSVPINWAYNHHYMAWMTGAHSELKRVPAAEGDPMAHGAATKNVIVDKPSAAPRKFKDVPTGQMFSEGNGGESRKSFHGYPNGFAQLVESPETWHITPMQIDTRNRDCGATPADIDKCRKFTPGPEPRQARHGRGTPKETNYSGILECPCNSRYGGDPMFYPDSKTKIVEHTYTTLVSGTCANGQGVADAATCFAVAPTLGISAKEFINKTVSDPKLPPGCSVSTETNGSAIAYFNSMEEAHGTCTGGDKTTGETKSDVNVTLHLALDATTLFTRSPKGKYCENNHADLIKAFKMTSSTLAAAYAARSQCEQYCWQDSKCWGCSVDCPGEPLSYGFLGKACQWNAISSCGNEKPWSGSIKGDITQKNPSGGVATITASGPADVWFGIGLNAQRMADSPYTLVVNSSGVIEQKIGTCGSEAEHCAGDRLESSVRVLSNSVVNGVRTVVMTRPFLGKTSKHFSFSPGMAPLHLITAVGQTPVFAYHKMHAPALITLTTAGSSTCVCDTGAAGQLCNTGGVGCNQFVKACVPPNPLNYTGASAGDLLAQRNPTCNSKQYVGGLSCCGHRRIMLDADQEVRPELLRYHMKFRFWFQEYVPIVNKTGKPSHLNLERIYYQTEANAGEYDIPPAFAVPGQPIPGYGKWPENTPTPGTTCTGTCPDGPDCACVHTITYHFQLENTVPAPTRLIYAGGHCHAPACISIELYENSTGTPNLLCRQLPLYGKGNVTGDKYDEAGYLALPPCLWSDKGGEGLEPSVWLPHNTPMISIKKNHNTHVGHYGEMASWQMRGVHVPPDTFLV
mmetsp:Transcript_36428/g.67040  ORF Transcript_36428/g.67040 Transcript_36428/m.67040 type:complete len:907 (-) Transcript_36428:128-2848(-)